MVNSYRFIRGIKDKDNNSDSDSNDSKTKENYNYGIIDPNKVELGKLNMDTILYDYKKIIKQEKIDQQNLESEDKNLITNNTHKIKENPLLVIPLTFTALVSVILGIYPDFIIRIAKMVL